MKNVYAYIRVSTVKQGMQGSSLIEQRRAIEQYAQQHNLSIVQWFEERQTAAKKGRTIFNQMLSLLVKGKSSGVIIHKIDRGARNLKDWADLGGLIDKGVDVHFAHESLDMRSRGGRLAADIQAVVAADFIRNLRDEIKKGFRGRLRQGLYPLPAPLGYDNNGRGLPKTPNPIMTPLIQHAFKLYATGEYNLYLLGKEMYVLGLRNQAGGRVSKSGLSKMLNNEFYIGVIYIASMGERFQGIHEPIIKKSLFDSVKNVLGGRIKNRGLKHTFRYRKTLRCVFCNYNFTAERQKGIVYYRCQTRDCARACVREDIVDKQVKKNMGSISLSPIALQKLEKEFSYLDAEQILNRDNYIASAELIVSKLDIKITRLTDAYIDRLIDKEVFEERNKKLLHERVEAREKLSEINNNKELSAERSKKFLELVKAISQAAEMDNPHENRDLLKSATSNFQMDGKRLVVTWLNPFDELYESHKLLHCEPSRDRGRTSSSKISKLAKTLYKGVHLNESLSKSSYVSKMKRIKPE